MSGQYAAIAQRLVREDFDRRRAMYDPDPLYVVDEPWPLYPAPPRRNHRWLVAALAVLALIAWRKARD